MKKITGIIVSALVTIVATVASADPSRDSEATMARLQGVWQVDFRVCQSSGKSANDAFILGRDKMEIAVTGTRASLHTSIKGRMADTWQGVFNFEHGYIVMRPTSSDAQNRRITKVPFQISRHSTLIITTDGFGPGGSCATGETLDTYFRLKGVTK